MRHLLQKYAFTLWLVVAVGLAVALPEPAAAGGMLHSEWTTKFGVAVIFFLLGTSIPLRQLLDGCRPLRLHAFTCCWNYVAFPLLTGGVLLVFTSILPERVALGFWILACMPTTIASAVAFTELSKGDTPNAIFSTVFSNALSVFIVPLYATVFLSLSLSAEIPFLPLLMKIALLVLMPLVCGQVLRRLLLSVALRLKSVSKLLSSAIILFIVHAAFANSVQSESLTQLSFVNFVAILGVVVLLLGFVSLFVWWSLNWMRFSSEQRVAAFYCASQKSLATGLPLATLVLATVPEVGAPALLLLPLILFHPLQLVLAGVLAKRWSTRFSES